MPSVHPSPKPSDLTDYRRDVEQMFTDKSTALIRNSCTAHARILIETMVARSQKTLVFFCENLKKEIYDQTDLIKAIHEASKRGVKIRILVQNKPECEWLVKKSQELQDGVPIDFRVCRAASPGAAADVNFIVMDSTAFRFEEDREKHVAFASANNVRLAQKMEQKYEDFWVNADDYLAA